MPVTKLPPGTPLDPPGTVTSMPAGTALDEPARETSAPTAEGGLFDLPHLLPESVQKWLPSVLTGPTIGAQLDEAAQRRQAEEKRLGRPLTLRERIEINPVESNPVMGSFGTHQIGEAAGAIKPMAAAALGAVDRLPRRSTLVLAPESEGDVLSGAREKFITDKYTTAVRPTTAFKGTGPEVKEYNARVRGGIDSIIDNKNNLQFIDDAGNVRQGELPQNLEEFSHAIDQTKQKLFEKYDALAQKTQAAGINVSLMPIAAELKKIGSDLPTLLSNPKTAKYARTKADTFAPVNQITATEAQRIITNLNASLKAFYRKPSYKAAGRANVDAMIANQLREALDQAVANAVGPGYQELKNQYGALASFEKDVTNRAQYVARQDPGGGLFGRLADVATSAQAIHALATLNPATFASAIATKGSAEFIKYWRSPNRAVRRLFETAEEQKAGPPQPVVPSFPLPPGIPSSERDRYVPGTPGTPLTQLSPGTTLPMQLAGDVIPLSNFYGRIVHPSQIPEGTFDKYTPGPMDFTLYPRDVQRMLEQMRPANENQG